MKINAFWHEVHLHNKMKRWKKKKNVMNKWMKKYALGSLYKIKRLLLMESVVKNAGMIAKPLLNTLMMGE
jgi:hypothetical protein